MSQGAASKKILFCAKNRQGTAKPNYGKTTMHFNKQLHRSCKVVDCDTRTEF